MRTHIRTALAASVVTIALALAGCSGGGSDEGTEAGSKESTTASEETQGATEEATEGATQGAEVPEGYQELTAPSAGISFAVPQDWVDLKSLSDEDLQAMAQEQGADPATFQQQIDSLDVFYRAAEPDESGLAENVTVETITVSATGTPTETDVTELLTAQGMELDEYGTVETPNGDAATGTYTNPANEAAQASVIMAPTSTEGEYAILYVTSSSAERTAELVRDIAGSIH